jgi:hypothetical protein
MMEHIALDFAAAVGDGFASSKFTAGFDLDVHERRGNERCIHCDAHGERIVHGRAFGVAVFFGKGHEKIADAVYEVVHRAMSSGEMVEVLAGEKRFVANVEADHGERPAGLEDDLRGFGIVVDIGFGGRVHVAALEGAAHENDFLDERNDGWIFLEGERDIGERADGNERDFMRHSVDQLDDEVGPVTRVDFAFAGGKLDIGEAIFAMPEFSGDELLKKRLLGASGDGNVATIGERNHTKRVLKALFGGDIAGNYGNGANIELGRIEREHESHGIIGAGIGVKDDFLADCGGGRSENTSKGDKENDAPQDGGSKNRFPFA